MIKLSTGTNLYECLALPTTWMFSIIIRDLIIDRINPLRSFTPVKLFFLDYFTFVFPQLLSQTLCADYLLEYVIFLAVLSIGIKCLIPECKERSQDVPASDVYTYLRGFIQISTAVAILGVDFQIFPRRFAKTISYGTSPMDFGTSMFVFGMGFGIGLIKKQQYDYSKKSLLKFFQTLVVLIVLGLSKPAFATTFNYPTIVKEYGTHWNFYMTLAALKFVSFLPSIFPIMIGTFGSIWFASSRDFEVYLLSDERNLNSLIDSNREGIFSLFGYILLLDLSRRFGEDLRNLFSELLSWKATCFSLASSAAYFGLYNIITIYFDYQASRRVANLPYVLIALGATHYTIGVIQIAMLLAKPRITKLQSLSNHVGSWSLTTFLTANLLTGLTNMVMQTDAIDSMFLQFSILFTYTLLLSGIVNFICCSNILSSKPKEKMG